MQAVMESCPAKSVMSGVMGFALGGAFGLFMSSVRFVLLCIPDVFLRSSVAIQYPKINTTPHLIYGPIVLDPRLTGS